ncbi:unnamed protein product [Rotaria sp. Silwood2]|nr:unnamed protein product [Rotaria sp. Silwood2]CAF3086518.1 unnamed protein product [Rotaria sp. Silwood2]CAF4070626.1 unnamed protein product [Rotaria sp. Silwood2]CAF4360973.1 unnamed protein product [Rotaria sp. Silwood2]
MISDDDDDDGQQEEEETTETSHDEEEITHHDQIELVYIALSTPNQTLINILSERYKDVQTFTDEIECVEHIKSTKNKIFFIIDGVPSKTLIEAMESLIQIDSVFVYFPSPDALTAINQKQHHYILNWCEKDSILLESIKKSLEDLEKHAATFHMFNKKEKEKYDLSKEQGSFIVFQSFKSVFKNMPKTDEAKKTMVKLCRDYCRGNSIELANIDEFDRAYKASDAIIWYMQDKFLHKIVNKTLRTQNIDLMYQFRFFITDLSEQLELKFQELKKTQKGVLKLYRSVKLSQEEVTNYQNSVEDLIANSTYLSTTSERSMAYDFVTKSVKSPGVVRTLFEYTIDLNIVQSIIIANVRQYSAFPEQAEFIIDCVHATDLVSEYVEYEKKKMRESNIMLLFGDLLIEMGEYAKAERYFDRILRSSNPNDEEIACIFFNFGRIYRLQGKLHRAINCYNRAYKLNMHARPERLASAGKCLNDLGIVYSEMGRQVRAEECFQGAMELYKISLPKDHIDVAGTLINLGTIDCDRQNFEEALHKYQEAMKIYDSRLPPIHPSRALLKVNLGNVHLTIGNYKIALQEYESALKLQEAFLPAGHADIARTLNNLEIVHTHLGNKDEANKYAEHAKKNN